MLDGFSLGSFELSNLRSLELRIENFGGVTFGFPP